MIKRWYRDFYLKVYLDKILKIIKRKVLKGAHLLVTIKRNPSRIFNQPLHQTRIPIPSTEIKNLAIRRTEAFAERYLQLSSLLFRLNTTPDKEAAVLAIPENCTERLITLCHSSLFGGCQGVLMNYLTLNKKFYILDTIHHHRVS